MNIVCVCVSGTPFSVEILKYLAATLKCFRQVRKVSIRSCATLKSEHFDQESHGRGKSMTGDVRVEAVPALAEGHHDTRALGSSG